MMHAACSASFKRKQMKWWLRFFKLTRLVARLLIWPHGLLPENDVFSWMGRRSPQAPGSGRPRSAR